MKTKYSLIVMISAFAVAASLTSCMVPVEGNRQQRAAAMAQNAGVANFWNGMGQAVVQGVAEGAAESLFGETAYVEDDYYEALTYYVPGYVPWYYGGVTYYRHPSWTHYRAPGHGYRGVASRGRGGYGGGHAGYGGGGHRGGGNFMAPRGGGRSSPAPHRGGGGGGHNKKFGR